MAKKDKKKSAATLLQQVQHTSRAIRTALASKLMSDGLYAGQDQIMLALSRGEGLTPGALALALNVRPPTITKTLNRLRAQGFLTKQASETDGRQAVIALTGKGAEAIENVEKSVRRTEKKALKGLDRKDIKALTKALARIEANLAALADRKDAEVETELYEEDEAEAPDTQAAKPSNRRNKGDGMDAPAAPPVPGAGTASEAEPNNGSD